MTLEGESTVFRHGKAKTLYVSIPSQIVQDSAFEIEEGDKVIQSLLTESQNPARVNGGPLV